MVALPWVAGHLRCPAGKLLRRATVRQEACHLRVIYRATVADCGHCALYSQCRGRPTGTRGARAVSVLESLPPAPNEALAPAKPTDVSTPAAAPTTLLGAAVPSPDVPSPVAPAPRLGPKAVWWVDVAASQARRQVRDHLRSQQVVMTPMRVVSPLAARPS